MTEENTTLTFAQRQELKELARQKIVDASKGRFNDAMYEKTQFSTGIYALDKKTHGGLPFGKPIEVYGENSSGKTTLALKSAAEVNKINYDTGKLDLSFSNPCSAAFLDLEASFDTDWALKLGFDRYAHGNNVDDILGGDTTGDVVKDFIDSDMYSMIIIDSLDRMFPIDVLESDMECNDVGLRAKTLYRAMRRWLVSLTKSYKRNKGYPWRIPTIVMLNHSAPIMMDQWGRKESMGGGAPKYYSVMRIEMTKLKIENDDKKEHGVGRFKATLRKNKVTGEAGTIAEWNMALKDLDNLEAGQIDNVTSIFADIRAYGLMEKTSGSKVVIFGEEYKTQKEFKQKMYDDPIFCNEIWNKTIQKVNE
jgi:RecA/RadA recombinase